VLVLPYVFGLTFSVNPNTAETSTGFPSSTGVSLTAFQYSPSTKTLPRAASIAVNAAVTGLLLIGLAFALFVFDVFAPTHGVLTVGGIVAFLIGSLMLFNRDDPLFRLSLAYIIPATIITALFFAFIVGKGLRAQFLPIKAGKETMLGKTVK
jgi:hypothetical protein